MTNEELLKKIELLEKRVALLEATKYISVPIQPYPVPYYPYNPTWTISFKENTSD